MKITRTSPLTGATNTLDRPIRSAVLIACPGRERYRRGCQIHAVGRSVWRAFFAPVAVTDKIRSEF